MKYNNKPIYIPESIYIAYLIAYFVLIVMLMFLLLEA